MTQDTKVRKSDAEWRAQLTEEQYQVTRRHGTERAFSGCYWDHHDTGTYRCVCCDTPLFASTTKFESGSGWPSYWEPIAPEAVTLKRDFSWGMIRTEVLCSTCAYVVHVNNKKHTVTNSCIGQVVPC